MNTTTPADHDDDWTMPCLTCGSRDRIEMHHVAGRVNFPDLVVPVCLECHLILSNWQSASGIPLLPEESRNELDRMRALIVGNLHLAQLFTQREADFPDRAELGYRLAEMMAQACSKVLDQAAEPDRLGRWVPDPTVRLRTADAAPTVHDHEAERLRSWLPLLHQVAEILGGLPLVTLARFRDWAVRPEDFTRAFEVIARDHAATTRMAFAVGCFVDKADQLVRLLFELPDVEELDDEVVRIGSECLRTGWDTLNLMLDLADDVTAATKRGQPW